MFILTNIDVRQDLVQVFDTQDGSNDVIRLSVVAGNVTGKNLKIYGLGKLSSMRRQSAAKQQMSQPITHLGVYVSVLEAKEAFATYYEQHGMPRPMARMRAGLPA